jgi:hypothetical protein
MKDPAGAAYGRCRMHGGAAARANWRHGRYSARTKAEAKAVRELMREVNVSIEKLLQEE